MMLDTEHTIEGPRPGRDEVQQQVGERLRRVFRDQPAGVREVHELAPADRVRELVADVEGLANVAGFSGLPAP